MRNTEVKNKLKESKIFQWELAERMGISEMTLVRKLRKELSNEEKQKIFLIINELTTKNSSKNI